MSELQTLINAPLVAPSLDLDWKDDVVALRRDFHIHPEIGFEEVRTAAVIAERCRALGLEVREGIGKTGVVATLKGKGGEGKHVLVRADMDALPVEEKNEWSWKSSTQGKMHACGHDCHVATALTVARLLCEERDTLQGTVTFMFQPAEEGMGGCEAMINDGLFDDIAPDYALGLHVWSETEVGKIAIASGPVMACAEGFKGRIIGKGGHGAIPQQTVDPVVIAAQVVLALQTIVSRNLDPLQQAVVTIGKIHAGNAFNVIPGEAELEGTVRSFDPQVREMLKTRCREIIEDLPKAFGARGEFEYIDGFPPVVNDAAVVEKIRPALASVVGEDNVVPFTPTMGGEDFALVLQRVPGCYFMVGGRNEAVGAMYPHHHEQFNIDEKALHIGAQAMVAAVKECLQ